MKSQFTGQTARIRNFMILQNEMEELLECENSYRNGDVFSRIWHNRWLLLESRLKELGYS